MKMTILLALASPSNAENASDNNMAAAIVVTIAFFILSCLFGLIYYLIDHSIQKSQHPVFKKIKKESSKSYEQGRKAIDEVYGSCVPDDNSGERKEGEIDQYLTEDNELLIKRLSYLENRGNDLNLLRTIVGGVLMALLGSIATSLEYGSPEMVISIAISIYVLVLVQVYFRKEACTDMVSTKNKLLNEYEQKCLKEKLEEYTKKSLQSANESSSGEKSQNLLETKNTPPVTMLDIASRTQGKEMERLAETSEKETEDDIPEK